MQTDGLSGRCFFEEGFHETLYIILHGRPDTSALTDDSRLERSAGRSSQTALLFKWSHFCSLHAFLQGPGPNVLTDDMSGRGFFEHSFQETLYIF